MLMPLWPGKGSAGQIFCSSYLGPPVLAVQEQLGLNIYIVFPHEEIRASLRGLILKGTVPVLNAYEGCACVTLANISLTETSHMNKLRGNIIRNGTRM